MTDTFRENLETLLRPAIDLKAPYAKVMVDEIVKAHDAALSSRGDAGTPDAAVLKELRAARTAWHEDFGVQISEPYARFLTAIGEAEAAPAHRQEAGAPQPGEDTFVGEGLRLFDFDQAGVKAEVTTALRVAVRAALAHREGEQEPRLDEIQRVLDQRIIERESAWQAERNNLYGAIEADETRLRTHADRAGVLYTGCDTPETMADKILELQAEREQWRAAVREYAKWHGGAHESDCPLDDTCACKGKPINDAINAICASGPQPIPERKAE